MQNNKEMQNHPALNKTEMHDNRRQIMSALNRKEMQNHPAIARII